MGQGLAKEWSGRVKGVYMLPISWLYPLYMLYLSGFNCDFLSVMMCPGQDVFADPAGFIRNIIQNLAQGLYKHFSTCDSVVFAGRGEPLG